MSDENRRETKKARVGVQESLYSELPGKVALVSKNKIHLVYQRSSYTQCTCLLADLKERVSQNDSTSA